MHLRQPAFTYSGCGTFTKRQRQNTKFIEAKDSSNIYQNELDKDLKI